MIPHHNMQQNVTTAVKEICLRHTHNLNRGLLCTKEEVATAIAVSLAANLRNAGAVLVFLLDDASARTAVTCTPQLQATSSEWSDFFRKESGFLQSCRLNPKIVAQIDEILQYDDIQDANHLLATTVKVTGLTKPEQLAMWVASYMDYYDDCISCLLGQCELTANVGRRLAELAIHLDDHDDNRDDIALAKALRIFGTIFAGLSE